MEKSNPDNVEMDLVIVASDTWPARIARLVRDLLYRRNLHLGQILYCRSVYEAAATAIELRRRDRAVKACIMVDYLPEREMNVFTTLTKLSRVSSIAFTGFSQRKKLIRAQQLGADDLLTPTGEADLKADTSREQNTIDESPTVRKARHPEQIPETTPSPPTTKSPPTEEPDENEPPLSRDEIDALLH